MIELFRVQDLIIKFLTTPSEMVLVLQLTPANVLIPLLEITQAKRKQSYFLKRKPQVITETNYKQMLIPGDMAPNPIEELAVLVEQVLIFLTFHFENFYFIFFQFQAYVPMLSNPKNHVGWPEVVRKDVKKQVYNLRTLIWQVIKNISINLIPQANSNEMNGTKLRLEEK